MTGQRGNGVDELIEQAGQAAELGIDAFWLGQRYDYDSLTALAAIAREVPGIDLGTSIVPTYPRHPLVMANQARTVQAASRGRFALGVGVSHAPSIEGIFGYSFDRPARHLREYLSALVPLLREGSVDFRGETLSARTGQWSTEVPGGADVPVLVSALGPRFLRIAGELADGTITLLAGKRTLAEHIVPSITTAATDAGRPAPKVVTGLAVVVTDEPEAARERAVTALAFYETVKSYRTLLDREGVARAAELAVIGDEETVAAELRRYADIGATEILADVSITLPAERLRTLRLLAEV
ncbi:LLM class F420-dependent oxidoreductase [Solihabitans fulvus]|uniref:LLM class F420-dependent oxidoreductase n=2 Tax=Solihabitans fulvus TaxID=1892852 RepID=A0A5B2WIM4_9PSEU|nr:LLM class F420-dependent oxidoreductase [Solihabitans fulvus]